MNSDTGKMKRYDDMTEEEKKSGKFFPVPEGMPISEIKTLSRSQQKREEYMKEVYEKKKAQLKEILDAEE